MTINELALLILFILVALAFILGFVGAITALVLPLLRARPRDED